MKVGIITMHKVLNFGSLLQAYALQQALDKMGIDNEIINYQFPYKNNTKKLVRLKELLHRLAYRLRVGTLLKKSKSAYFAEFVKNNLRQSKKEYNRISIKTNPPVYDIYMTGSDQVWNPKWIKSDTNFLLSFASEDKIKLSYASSFTTYEIKEDYRPLYSKYLKQYKSISVRESSGVKIVKELSGKEAHLVCDPTLLLNEQDYHKLADQSKIKIKEPYILVYLLGYMFNPLPEANSIISDIQEELNLQVVYIGGKYTAYNKKCLCLEEIGPNEFLWLFEHSSFVITSSFHGTAFASIFHKPLVALVRNKDEKDGRIPTLLKQLHNEDSIVVYNSKNSVTAENIESYIGSEDSLKEYRSSSLDVLRNMIKSIKK